MVKKNSVITQISILAISMLLTSATAINGALPQMKNSLGMTTTQGELVATVPALAVVIFVVLSSFIAQKIGVKKTVQLGLLLVGIGDVVPIFLTGYPLIIVSRFVLGAGFGLFNSLAVSIINLLYKNEPNKRAALLGFRGSAENIGSAMMTLVAGLLLAFGWKLSFGVYLLAFPILIMFSLFVPEINDQDTEEEISTLGTEEITRVLPQVYLLSMFALFLVMIFVAIGVRFPAMVASLKGDSYNASNFLAVMPIIGILTGATFGFVNRLFGEKCLYIGLGLLALSTILIGNSEDNFRLLLVGYFISGIPGSLIFPFIYNSLNKYAPSSKMNYATSIILIGCNLGNFVAPFGLRILQTASGSSSIFAPFKILFGLVLVVLVILWVNNTDHFQKRMIGGKIVNSK
ncbi:MFS transporter [Candidatus Enterococcus ferrettii]|uniref:Major facilitator superfamily (MFS) profile domain-containing protein n=1 Tax=Candidatus Enterococcus ferrettii TaxID=2815324 RepID=A0ABV0EU43_9ENTE|nr:MFS transporter [Enterococcus sp. 665A]MBO1339534.1 MFS transporter [Enterococcus sp. 665A]